MQGEACDDFWLKASASPSRTLAGRTFTAFIRKRDAPSQPNQLSILLKMATMRWGLPSARQPCPPASFKKRAATTHLTRRLLPLLARTGSGAAAFSAILSGDHRRFRSVLYPLIQARPSRKPLISGAKPLSREPHSKTTEDEMHTKKVRATFFMGAVANKPGPSALGHEGARC